MMGGTLAMLYHSSRYKFYVDTIMLEASWFPVFAYSYASPSVNEGCAQDHFVSECKAILHVFPASGGASSAPPSPAWRRCADPLIIYSVEQIIGRPISQFPLLYRYRRKIYFMYCSCDTTMNNTYIQQ